MDKGDMSKQGTFGRSSKLNTLEPVHGCTFDYVKFIKNHGLTTFLKIIVKQIKFFFLHINYYINCGRTKEEQKMGNHQIKGMCYLYRFVSGNISIT